MTKVDEQYDNEEIYCRKLGHHLRFKYCRTENGENPCRKIADCWFDKIPIGEFLRKNYSEEELGSILAPSRDKAATLVELIERARKSSESKR